jgi:hypothetical protein
VDVKDFPEELRSCADKFSWSYDFLGMIRGIPKDNSEGPACCPIEAVWLSKNNHYLDFMEAGKSMGLDRNDINLIANIADGVTCKDSSREALRKEMLNIVGLV